MTAAKRDITSDLRDRLRQYQQERASLQGTLANLNRRVAVLSEAIRGTEVILALEHADEDALHRIVAATYDRSRELSSSRGPLYAAAHALLSSPNSSETDELETDDWAPTSLPGILLLVMERGRSYRLRELSQAAAAHGYDFGEKSPARATNATLMTMKKRGEVERTQQGSWRVAR